MRPSLAALALSLASVGMTRGLCIGETPIHPRNINRIEPLPPEVRTLTVPELPVDLVERQQSAPSSTASSALPSSPSTSPAAPFIPVAPSVIPSTPPTPVPTPMDLQLSYALSNTCLTYLSTVLTTPTFQSCLPFSLLQTTSTSFAALLSAADTGSNYTSLNELIAYVTSPQPSGAECDAFMADVYGKMADKGNCGSDLTSKKATAVTSRLGFGTAGLMRRAAGLRNPDTGRWCYLEAVSGDRPDDLYLWSIPAGIALPPSTKPTCSKCSSLLLNQYTSSITSTSALNSTLVQSAVNTVNSACGQGFASYAAHPIGATSGARASTQSGGVLGIYNIMAGAAAINVAFSVAHLVLA